MKTQMVVEVTFTDFNRGLKKVRQAGGKYLPESKTWLIDAEHSFLNAPGAYGLKIVAGIVSPTAGMIGSEANDVKSPVRNFIPEPVEEVIEEPVSESTMQAEEPTTVKNVPMKIALRKVIVKQTDPMDAVYYAIKTPRGTYRFLNYEGGLTPSRQKARNAAALENQRKNGIKYSDGTYYMLPNHVPAVY